MQSRESTKLAKINTHKTQKGQQSTTESQTLTLDPKIKLAQFPKLKKHGEKNLRVESRMPGGIKC